MRSRRSPTGREAFERGSGRRASRARGCAGDGDRAGGGGGVRAARARLGGHRPALRVGKSGRADRGRALRRAPRGDRRRTWPGRAWDAVYLSLHGAAITRCRLAPELDLVKAVREAVGRGADRGELRPARQPQSGDGRAPRRRIRLPDLSPRRHAGDGGGRARPARAHRRRRDPSGRRDPEHGPAARQLQHAHRRRADGRDCRRSRGARGDADPRRVDLRRLSVRGHRRLRRLGHGLCGRKPWRGSGGCGRAGDAPSASASPSSRRRSSRRRRA